MRVFTLLLCFVLSTGLAYGQKKVEKKKEIIIIKTDENGKEIDEEKLVKDLKEVDGIDEILAEVMKTIGDTTDIDVEVEVTVENGVTMRKYVVKSMVDGKEMVREVVEEVEEGEEDVTTFVLEMDGEIDEIPKPTVSMGVMISKGNKIEEVVDGSAADIAGLMKGDKILKVDQQVIYSINGLLEHLGSYKAGDKATVTMERDGVVMTKEITFLAK